jgi:hypothetical protein
MVQSHEQYSLLCQTLPLVAAAAAGAVAAAAACSLSLSYTARSPLSVTTSRALGASRPRPSLCVGKERATQCKRFSFCTFDSMMQPALMLPPPPPACRISPTTMLRFSPQPGAGTGLRKTGPQGMYSCSRLVGAAEAMHAFEADALVCVRNLQQQLALIAAVFCFTFLRVWARDHS